MTFLLARRQEQATIILMSAAQTLLTGSDNQVTGLLPRHHHALIGPCAVALVTCGSAAFDARSRKTGAVYSFRVREVGDFTAVHVSYGGPARARKWVYLGLIASDGRKVARLPVDRSWRAFCWLWECCAEHARCPETVDVINRRDLLP